MPSGPRGDQPGAEPRWGPSTTHRARPTMRRREEQGPGAVRARTTRDGAGSAVAAPERPTPRPPRGASPAPVRRAAENRAAGSAPRRRGRLRTRVGLGLAVLLVLAVAYPVALAYRAMGALGRVDALSASTTDDTPGRNYLVVGSDSRDGTELEAVEGSRTDTIMLLHVPRSGPTVLMSIPRDSFVEIPGNGEGKVNAAYSIGGAPLLAQTVEQATGVHVDDYVETGLAGFGEVVDAIGGITICPARAIQDGMTGLDIQPGCQPADGATALAYARTRYEDPRGDLGRVERQREVLAAIANESFAPATVLNPFNAFPLADKGGGALTVDEETGPVALARFLLGMRATAGGDGISLTVPIEDTTRRTDQGVVVDWDDATAEVVFAALRDSETEAIRQVADAQRAAAEG